MKKKSLYGVLAVCLFMLSSCLGDPASNLTLANQAGVVTLTPLKAIYVKGGDVLSSTEFQNAAVDQDECILFDYSFDPSLPLNTEGSLTYKTANIYANTLTRVGKWNLFDVLRDTVKPAKDELTLTLLQNRYAYIRGRLFLFAEMNHRTNQKDSFALSYNPQQQLDGSKVYDLYLSTIRLSTDTTAARSMIIPCAIDIQNFINGANTVEEDGQKAVNFRIRYVSGFNADTTKCVWKSTDVLTVTQN